MELSPSTFVLEIVNFLVLVWILKRFLYRPVLDVIAKRRSAIEKTLSDAKTISSEAQALKDRYENRLVHWEAERQGARDKLMGEIADERTLKIKQLHTVIDQEREKAKVVELRRQVEARRQLEQTALTQGARFAARLLEQLADPALESRLFELVIAELSSLDAERGAAFSENAGPKPASIAVSSAFTPSDEQRRRLNDALKAATHLDVPVEYEQDPALLAGLRITIGAWSLGMNLQDELEGFARSTHDDG